MSAADLRRSIIDALAARRHAGEHPATWRELAEAVGADVAGVYRLCTVGPGRGSARVELLDDVRAVLGLEAPP